VARKIMTGGAWLLGLALVLAAVVPLLDLDDWETGVAIWEAGLFASGLGLAVVLSAFAWHWGVGGVGTVIMALGIAGGLVDWLVVRAPTMAVVALALVCVGLPLQVRAIARATGLIGPGGTLGAAALGAAGIAFTSRLAYQTGAGGESAEIALTVATVIGLLVAAMCAGMAVSAPPAAAGSPPVSAAPPPAPADPSPASPAAPPVSPVPAAAAAALSKTDDAVTRAAVAEPLSRYQRLTLALALLGTVLAALISVAGSLLTNSLAG
jgi:hypothetical protein